MVCCHKPREPVIEDLPILIDWRGATDHSSHNINRSIIKG